MADRRRRRGSGRGPGRAGLGRLGRGPQPAPRGQRSDPGELPGVDGAPPPAAVAEAWERATETAARPPRPDLPRPDFPDRPLLSQAASPGTPQMPMPMPCWAEMPMPEELPPAEPSLEEALAAAQDQILTPAAWLVAAVVAEGLVHRDGANLVDDAAARRLRRRGACRGRAAGPAAGRSTSGTADLSTPKSLMAPWPTASRTSTAKR